MGSTHYGGSREVARENNQGKGRWVGATIYSTRMRKKMLYVNSVKIVFF